MSQHLGIPPDSAPNFSIHYEKENQNILLFYLIWSGEKVTESACFGTLCLLKFEDV